MREKVVDLNELSRLTRELKTQGKIIVQCHGVFDIVHIGHIKHFAAAKREGDVLVVTVTPDRYVTKGPGRPVFNQEMRAEAAAAQEDIDYVAINEYPTAVETIKKLKPDVYAKGSDYPEGDPTGKIVEEQQAIEEVGGRFFVTNWPMFSATKLARKYFPIYPEKTEMFLESLRQHYSAKEVIGRVKALANLRVMVVGETIIDEYCFCNPEGISPHSGITTHRYVGEDRFAGAATVTANHIANFCRDVTLVTCANKDDGYEGFIREQLAPNIEPVILHTEAPTIVKRRFMDSTARFILHIIDEAKMDCHEELAQYLSREVSKYDLVIVNDFGHGFISREVVPNLAGKKYFSLNAQTNSSNIGFNLFTWKYGRADYLCQNEVEVRLAAGDKSTDLKILMGEIATAMNTKVMAVTLGSDGSLLYDGNFHHTPPLTANVIDTLGAGDAFLAITSVCAAAGYPADLIGFLGNAYAALKAEQVGNKPVDIGSFHNFINTLLK